MKRKRTRNKGRTVKKFPVISIIGCGHMGGAILRALAGQKKFDRSSLIACDRSIEHLSAIEQDLRIPATPDVERAYRSGSIVIFAVKPKDLDAVLTRCGKGKGSGKIIISVVAGARPGYIAKKLGSGVRVAIVMPNMPALIGLGMSAIYSADDLAAETAKTIFTEIGLTYRLSREDQIHAAAGLNASGPGFIFTMLDALIDGGLRVGLDRAGAQLLAAQTMLGSAAMVLESGHSPAALKEQIVTPGGTTIAGLRKLEKGAVRFAIMEAVEAAADRAASLGKYLMKEAEED